MPLHVHYEEDEGFYVLEGSVSITVGDDVVELKAGEHAYGPRGIPHRFDIGPEGARMVWVLTPGGFEDFVEEASVPAEALTTAPPEHPAARGHRGDRPAGTAWSCSEPARGAPSGAPPR